MELEHVNFMFSLTWKKICSNFLVILNEVLCYLKDKRKQIFVKKKRYIYVHRIIEELSHSINRKSVR